MHESNKINLILNIFLSIVIPFSDYAYRGPVYGVFLSKNNIIYHFIVSAQVFQSLNINLIFVLIKK